LLWLSGYFSPNKSGGHVKTNTKKSKKYENKNKKLKQLKKTIDKK